MSNRAHRRRRGRVARASVGACAFAPCSITPAFAVVGLSSRGVFLAHVCAVHLDASASEMREGCEDVSVWEADVDTFRSMMADVRELGRQGGACWSEGRGGLSG